MSNTDKGYTMEKGQFNLHLNSEESIKENPKRPTHWGNLVVPEGAKAGDTIKLSGWKKTSAAGKNYISGKSELAVKPDGEANSNELK